jgi:hypothetical protein
MHKCKDGTCPCPMRDRSSPCPPPPNPISWLSNLMLSSNLRLYLLSGQFPSGCPPSTPNPIRNSSPHTWHVTRSPHRPWFYHWNMWWGVQITKTSMHNLLHLPVTSSLLGPNTPLSTLFSNTLSLYSFLYVRDQTLHQHTTRQKSKAWHFIRHAPTAAEQELARSDTFWLSGHRLQFAIQHFMAVRTQATVRHPTLSGCPDTGHSSPSNTLWHSKCLSLISHCTSPVHPCVSNDGRCRSDDSWAIYAVFSWMHQNLVCKPTRTFIYLRCLLHLKFSFLCFCPTSHRTVNARCTVTHRTSKITTHMKWQHAGKAALPTPYWHTGGAEL